MLALLITSISAIAGGERPRGKALLYEQTDHFDPTPDESAKIKSLILSSGRKRVPKAERDREHKELIRYGRLYIPVYLDVLAEEYERSTEGKPLRIALDDVGLSAYATLFENATPAPQAAIRDEDTDDLLSYVKAWRIWWEQNKRKDIRLADPESNIALALKDFFYGTPESKLAAAEDLDFVARQYSIPGVVINLICARDLPEELFATDLQNYLRRITGTKIPNMTKENGNQACGDWNRWVKASRSTFKWPSHVEMLKKGGSPSH
ncbi:MAG TPA: hypothetical protein VN915_00475 [Elusimicrobiota bacterium]|nr:hypothetical protein [Elusimicrobiota bacterium]